jgi:spermidine synthase
MVKNIKKVVPSFRYMSGKYKVKNKEKYIGDLSEVIFRSSYERKFMVFCDLDPSVLKWSSEPYSIPYLDTLTDKTRNYFVDFYAKIKKPSGETQDYIVEVKPRKKLNKPLKPNRESLNKLKNYNAAMHEYLTNLSKFSAAKSYALKIGYKFIIVTEKELYGKP